MKTKIGFIGCGQMAHALARGIASNADELEICGYDPSAESLNAIAQSLDQFQIPFRACQSNQEVLETSQYVFVAVKPQVVGAALKGLQMTADQLFISVVAGITISKLESLLNESIIRAMPNTPCLIGHGAIAMSASAAVSPKQIETVKSMFASIGRVLEVPESLMDAVTGLSGSGPAYVYTFIESLIDGGVLVGLPRNAARQLAIQTVLGAAEMVAHADQHPAMLRDRVTSPGGTTIHGLKKLEEFNFRNSVLEAVVAATQRSKDLGQQ